MAENISQLVLRQEKEEERNLKEQGSMHGNGGQEPPPSPSMSESSSSSHHHNNKNPRDASKKPFFKLDVKFDLPMFNGESNVENLNNWIRQIEVYCRIQQIVDDEVNIQLASLQLSSTTLIWWERKLQSSKNYLRQGKGQDVQSFTEEFRKQALNLGIALDTPEVVTKYIGSLHSYIRNSLLLFERTNIDSASVKVIHIENRGKNERDDHSKKPPFKPLNDKSKAKWKGKKKKTTTAKEGERPYCNHCKKEGHDDDHCWKQHPEKTPKKYGGKGKQKTVETTQQDLGSDSKDEALIIAIGTKGTLTPHVNFESHEGTSFVNESLPNGQKRIELFHIRVVINHRKVETLFDTGSQENLIAESLVKKLGLEIQPHPKPYPLGWIHDKAKWNVTKQCKVS
eukprot:PITA_26054